MPTFKTRRVGQTALEVSELGLGTATMAGIFTPVPDEQARATVGTALDAGITFYDTAPQYGLGRAEHLLGDGLRDRRKGTVLSSRSAGCWRPIPAPRPSAATGPIRSRSSRSTTIPTTG